MKIKLELEFDNESELLKISKAINDAVNGNTQPVSPFLDSAVEEVTDEQMTLPVDQEEPSSVPTKTTMEISHDNSVANDESVSEPVQKRKRRTKAELKTVDTTTDNEVLTDEERKENAKAIAAQMEKNVAAQETVAPKNFYSLSEFLNNFAVILNNLVKDGTLTHRSLTEYCSQYGVPFIYALSKDKKKLEDFYNLLIKQGHIVKKGDY